MKIKALTLVFLLLLNESTKAQRAISVGGNFNFSESSLNNNSKENSNLNFNFKFKSSLGGNLSTTIHLTSKLELLTSIGIQQRGSIFYNAQADYLPRYKFLYLDYSLGILHNFSSITKFSPFISVAFIHSSLIAAKMKNNIEVTEIKNEIQPIDYNIKADFGYSYKLKNNQVISLACFYTQGLKNVFNSLYSSNNLSALNYSIGLNVGFKKNFNLKTKK